MLTAPRGNVRIEGVRFGYKEGELVYEDLNIEVRQGQTVAIVGPTGAGKTTLVSLLLRFYDVQAGSIKVDGVDIRDLPRGICAPFSAWCSRIPGCSRAP